MDLEALADNLVGGPARLAASEWLAELPTAPNGDTVKHHVHGENNLPSTADGLAALRRFVQALASRGSGGPVEWYETALRDVVLDLVPHGPEADPGLPDALCRLQNAWTVWLHLGRPDRPPIPPASVDHPRYQRIVERWLRDVVCSPAYLDALDPVQPVSAALSVFSTFEEDREASFPAGTPADHCLQIVGKDPMSLPTAHALFKYRCADVGPAQLPTAFDAALHRHFVPSLAGAPCGTTKNLMTSDGRGGVREVVVRTFAVSMLQQPEFVQA